MTPLRALIAAGDSVATTIPSATVVVQAVWGLGPQAITGRPSGPATGRRPASSLGIPISTTQMRQAPSGGNLAWEEKMGVGPPAPRAAPGAHVPPGPPPTQTLMVH